MHCYGDPATRACAEHPGDVHKRAAQDAGLHAGAQVQDIVLAWLCILCTLQGLKSQGKAELRAEVAVVSLLPDCSTKNGNDSRDKAPKAQAAQHPGGRA